MKTQGCLYLRVFQEIQLPDVLSTRFTVSHGCDENTSQIKDGLSLSQAQGG